MCFSRNISFVNGEFASLFNDGLGIKTSYKESKGKDAISEHDG